MALANAKRLMFWGESVSAAEAKVLGLADIVVGDEALIASTDALVAKLADKSPLVLRRMKAAINRGNELPVRLALQWERDINELHSHSHDRAEGLLAFKEKRPPRFTGR